MKFVITRKYWKDKIFPSLNDLLHQASRNPRAYSRVKSECETIVIDAIRTQIRGYKATSRVRLDIVWGEPNKGQIRDFDNIVSAGRKIICDALVKLKVIEDDKPQYLAYGNNEFVYVDKPFIEVNIIEVETPFER